MSGYKHATVTISQEEYRRLQASDVKKRFKEFTKLSIDSSDHNAQVLNLIQQLEERESQLQVALGSVAAVPDQHTDEVLQNILIQNASYYESLADSFRNSHSNMQDAIEQLESGFAQQMERNRALISRNVQSIFLAQESYQNQEYMKQEAAEQWFNRCLILVEFIQTQFDHDRFTPGKLDRILRSLSYAENNLANGFSESSLQGSQQLYLDLTDLNFELEQLMLQLEMVFENTYSAVNALIYQMEANREVCAIGLRGEQLPSNVELNYWTDGRFSQLLEHCHQLSNYLYQDRAILALEDLERIYSQILPVIRESFESLVYEARLNALNSQLRMNIAEKALQALENHGFSLAKAGYAENDMRSQFNAHLECADGSQVTIQVLPTEESTQELSNELVVITTHPYLKTEHEARLHWEELSRTLSQFNLQVSRPEIMTEQRDESSRDTPSSSQSPQSKIQSVR